jgi:ribosomal protein S18 acetylase RimI-like enzyme
MRGIESLKLSYPGANPHEVVVLERLTPDTLDRSTLVSMFDVKSRAYASQLEPPRGWALPAGTIAREAATADETYWREEEEDTRQSLGPDQAEPHAYWVIREEDDPSRPKGYIHVARLKHEFFITNISVVPEYQGFPNGSQQYGYGRRLLHAACTQPGFSTAEVRTVGLYGFLGSSVNNWYKGLGFEPTPEIQEVYFDRSRMLMQKYQLPAGRLLGALVSTLERRYPELEAGRVLSKTA